MKSNLPLLFVNGFPTSLNKMSVCELERFIPFMIQCSLGQDRIDEYLAPKWWPHDLPYPKAFVKYNKNDENWKCKLKSLVQSCYTYHDCNFLLRFCSDLSKHPRNALKFVNNCDSTTSLFHKGTGKLLVTFRNENILYDKIIPARKRKYLKPHDSNAKNTSALFGMLPSMVEEDPVDIYLCDNCDAVLHSSEEMKEHEVICREEPTSTTSPELLDEDQESFFNYFSLSSNSSSTFRQLSHKPSTPSTPIRGRSTRVARACIPHPFVKSAVIPFSSPAGILMAKRSRHTVSEETHSERRERTERYCAAPPLCDETPSWLHEPTASRTYNLTYRKAPQTWVHIYRSPKSSSKIVLDEKSQIKYLHCTHVSVRVKCDCDMFSKYSPDVIDLCSSDDDDELELVKIDTNKHSDVRNNTARNYAASTIGKQLITL